MSVKLAGCIIRDDQKRTLLIHRNTPILQQWEIPGGKIENGETPEAAAIRELREELGVEVEIIRKLGEKGFSQSRLGWHYTWFLGRIAAGELTVMEPDKFDEFDYFSSIEMHALNMSSRLSPNARNYMLSLDEGQISLGVSDD